MLSYSQGEAQEKLFQYNLNGELTQIAQGSEYTSFTPDALGRIKAVTLPYYSTLSYSLDHSGRRVQKLKNGSKVYRNIYEDEFKIAAEVGPLGQFKEYVYATNINSADYIKDGSKHYKILKDHLGSPRLVVNASTGAIVQRMDYNEWGMVTLDTNPGFQAFGFAGGIYDQDTKLVKFGARDYDGSTGRWLSKDPILFDGGDTNLYGYVINDPVNFVDYNGRNPVAVAAVGVGAATGAAVGFFSGISTSNSCTVSGKFRDGAKGAAYGALGGAIAGFGAAGGGIIGSAAVIVGSAFAGAAAGIIEFFGP